MLTVRETTMVVALDAVFQLYVLAPDAVNVALLPIHTAVGPLIAMPGNGLIERSIVAVCEQLLESVPVTV